MKKKILGIVLALSMLACAAPTGTMADSDDMLLGNIESVMEIVEDAEEATEEIEEVTEDEEEIVEETEIEEIEEVVEATEDEEEIVEEVEEAAETTEEVKETEATEIVEETEEEELKSLDIALFNAPPESMTEDLSDYNCLYFQRLDEDAKITVQAVEETLVAGNHLWYSTDKENWTEVTWNKYDPTTIITLTESEETVYLVGEVGENKKLAINLKAEKDVAVGGDITTLLNKTGNVTALSAYGKYTFQSLFKSAKIKEFIPDFIMPSIALTEGCYKSMFIANTMAEVPRNLLPATEMKDNCYVGMFEGCTNLTNGPDLPAKDLANGCYDNMFGECSALSEIRMNCLSWEYENESCIDTFLPENPEASLNIYLPNNADVDYDTLWGDGVISDENENIRINKHVLRAIAVEEEIEEDEIVKINLPEQFIYSEEDGDIVNLREMGRQQKNDTSEGRSIFLLTQQDVDACAYGELVIIGVDPQTNVTCYRKIENAYTRFYDGESEILAKDFSVGSNPVVAFAFIDDFSLGYGYFRAYANSIADEDNFLFQSNYDNN